MPSPCTLHYVHQMATATHYMPYKKCDVVDGINETANCTLKLYNNCDAIKARIYSHFLLTLSPNFLTNQYLHLPMQQPVMALQMRPLLLRQQEQISSIASL